MFKILIDGQIIKPEDYQLANPEINFLKDNGILQFVSRKYYIDFVGCVFLGGELFVCFPKTTILQSIGDEEVKEKGRLLIKSILKYIAQAKKELSNTELAKEFDSSHTKEWLDQINLYKKLLEDYRMNGLIKEGSRKTFRGSSGKINWSKTIKNSQPIINSNGSVLYLETTVQKPITSLNKTVDEIHKFCLAKADSIFGWYFSNNGKNSCTPFEINKNKLRFSVETAKRIIRRELKSEYATRKIILYKLILNILDNENEIGEGRILGINNFWRMWEYMCSTLFKNVYKEKYKERIPQPVYRDGQQKEVSRGGSIGQRYDIISEAPNYLLLVDAKYYDIRKNLPGWADIVKQLFYEKNLRLLSEKPIINTFCLPLPKGSEADMPSEVNMESRFIENEILSEEYPSIHCIYFDIWDILKSFYYKKERSTIEGSFQASIETLPINVR